MIKFNVIQGLIYIQQLRIHFIHSVARLPKEAGRIFNVNKVADGLECRAGMTLTDVSDVNIHIENIRRVVGGGRRRGARVGIGPARR